MQQETLFVFSRVKDCRHFLHSYPVPSLVLQGIFMVMVAEVIFIA